MRFADLESFIAQIDLFLWPEQSDKQRRNRQRILEAATGLFVRLGYRKTNIDDVAREAGVAKGTVYLYYTNKAELVYHAIALEKRAFLSRISPLTDPATSALDRLRSMIELAVLMSRQMPLTASLVQGEQEIRLAIQDMDAGVLKTLDEQRRQLLQQLLNEATGQTLPPDQLALRTQILSDLLVAITSSSSLATGETPLRDYATNFAQLVVHGLVSPSDHSHARSDLGWLRHSSVQTRPGNES